MRVSVTPRPHLTPGRDPVPIVQEGRSGQMRNISAPPGFDSRTVQPVGSRYTDYVTRPMDKRGGDKTTNFGVTLAILVLTLLGKREFPMQRRLSASEFISRYLQYKSVSPCHCQLRLIFSAFKLYKNCPHENTRIEKC